MLRYKPEAQIEIFEFQHPFEVELDPRNRWVKLSKILPWDELVSIYSKGLSKKEGRYGIDGRLAVGSLIIKHRLKLSDREVISTLQENIYLQYFVGFKEFKKEKAFDPSLFVHLRKRLGAEAFDAMTQAIITLSEGKRRDSKKPPNSPKGKDNIETEKEKETKNNGKLKIDATVADQMIEYPTDHNLLNKAREESERIIDLLYKGTDLEKKPRTYRRTARKEYLSFSKKRTKSKKVIRKAVGKQLRYLRRNLNHIDMLLSMFVQKEDALTERDQRILFVIRKLYDQQLEMYQEKKHSIKDRIVSIYQPYVRPIPRGKAKSRTEFGAKLGVSLVDGFSRINNINWDAYHEGTDLERQVEDYKTLYGYYPEVLLADKSYLSRENRKYLKGLGIRVTGSSPGRPCKNESYYQKTKKRKEHRERNHIEGKFGQGKNAYGLSRIRARRQDTSESWIAAIFFVMNLVHYEKLWHLFSFSIILKYKRAKYWLLRLTSSIITNYFPLKMVNCA